MPRSLSFAIAVTGSLFVATASAQTPVAHYALSFDLQDSAGANHGTFEGTGGPNAAPNFVFDAEFGSVLSFDGVDDRINLGNVLTLSGISWTISFWVKTSEQN